MLNEYNFKSIFKNELNYFIKYKRSLGLKYENEIQRIRKIDNILFELNLKSKEITKEIFYKLTERNNMQGTNYSRQYNVTKDFCIFLISKEYSNIYYENKKFKTINNYKPLIFSDDEIQLFFDTADKYKETFKGSKFYQLYYSYCIVFRLLYACGIRVSEVLNLNINDINFEENTINIINSKRHVSRMIVFSESMKICLEDYIKMFNITDELLFKNTKGNKLGYEYLRRCYKYILAQINLDTKSHLHDFRHNFCNAALNQMLEKGFDENVVIVYLYKFMGHYSIRETEYYLHFTDYNKKKIIETNAAFSKKIYEGVDLGE